MAVRYFLAENPIHNHQQQDCCLVVEVHARDQIDEQWVQQAAENAMGEKFGKSLSLWSANEDEALQYLEVDSDVTGGSLDLGTGVPLFWHLLRIG
jgi:hypothetical protein